MKTYINKMQRMDERDYKAMNKELQEELKEQSLQFLANQAQELKMGYESLEEKAEKANGYIYYAKDTKAPIFNEGFIIGHQQGYLQTLHEIEVWVKKNSMAMSEDDLAFHENAVDSDELLDFINQLKSKK